MMRAKSTCNLPSSRPAPRFRISRNAKPMDIEDAKMILDIIIRPSLQLCKLALGRGALTPLKRSKKTATRGDDTSSASSETPQKRVRFNEQPVTISRRGLFERFRKNSTSSPTRSCLVIRLSDDVSCKPPGPPSLEPDDHSIYEDCLSEHPGFAVDLQVLEPLDTRSPRCIRRSEFYETESGIATFDRTGYANYCLSKWLDKQREDARTPKKLVFDDPVLLPWSNHVTLSPPSRNSPGAAHLLPLPPPPSLPSSIYRPPQSLPRRIWKYVEDEFQNAIVVFIIGLFIHTCLFAFLLYDVLTRGFIPSDD